MIAAIYARKSSEQNGVGDEDKSVTRQVEHAKAFHGQWRGAHGVRALQVAIASATAKGCSRGKRWPAPGIST